MSWQNKLLTFGGRYILIRHVLQSMPINTLSAMNPPKGVIYQLHKIFSKIFWGGAKETKRKHWVALDKLCYPKIEGDLDFRSLHDVLVAFWQSFGEISKFLLTYFGENLCGINTTRNGILLWQLIMEGYLYRKD